MSDDSDFARFDNMPGFQLVDYKRVGLPVYQVQLDVLAEERRELHLVSEYCLRLLQAGVDRLDDLTRLLGVSQHIVRVEVADLVRLNAASERDGVLSITQFGKEILEPYGDMVCKEATWYVPFDAILRRPYPWRADQLRTSRQLADLEPHLEVNPIGDRPDSREFEINVVSQVLSQLRVGGRDMDRLVSVRGVRKSPLRFVSAMALAYESRSSADGDARIMFLIDGRRAAAHDDAFVKGNGLRRPMFRPLGARQDTEVQQRTTARRRLARSRPELSSTRSLAGKLSLPGSEESVADISDLPIYLVRSRWAQAISAAATQLVVTTRSISPSYLNSVLQPFARLLGAGVRLYLGIDSELIKANDDRKVRALATLQTFQRQHPNVTIRALDNLTVTHLIIDSRVLLVGDYDWLMPEGARTRQFRHTWMLQTETAAIIEKETVRVLGEFQAATSSAFPPTAVG